jgi:hypothetical protein
VSRTVEAPLGAGRPDTATCERCTHPGAWHRLRGQIARRAARYVCLGCDPDDPDTVAAGQARTGLTEPPYCFCPDLQARP